MEEKSSIKDDSLISSQSDESNQTYSPDSSPKTVLRKIGDIESRLTSLEADVFHSLSPTQKKNSRMLRKHHNTFRKIHTRYSENLNQFEKTKSEIISSQIYPDQDSQDSEDDSEDEPPPRRSTILENEKFNIFPVPKSSYDMAPIDTALSSLVQSTPKKTRTKNLNTSKWFTDYFEREKSRVLEPEIISNYKKKKRYDTQFDEKYKSYNEYGGKKDPDILSMSSTYRYSGGEVFTGIGDYKKKKLEIDVDLKSIQKSLRKSFERIKDLNFDF